MHWLLGHRFVLSYLYIVTYRYTTRPIHCIHHYCRRRHPAGASATADYPLSHSGTLPSPLSVPISLLDTDPTRSRAYMLQESTQNIERIFRSRKSTRQSKADRTTTLKRLKSPRRSRSISPKSIATPLSTVSGNLRTRGLGKKSQKAKKNKTQKKDSFLVLEDMSDIDIIIILDT